MKLCLEYHWLFFRIWCRNYMLSWPPATTQICVWSNTSIQLTAGTSASAGAANIKAATTIAIQLRFDYDDSYQNYDSTYQRVAKWASWQYVNEGTNSYQPTFCFGTVKGLYINVDNRRMLPDVDPLAWMPFLLPRRTLLRAALLPLDMPLDSTKKWTCSFFVAVESKPNRSCNSRLTELLCNILCWLYFWTWLSCSCYFSFVHLHVIDNQHDCCLQWNVDVYRLLLVLLFMLHRV